MMVSESNVVAQISIEKRPVYNTETKRIKRVSDNDRYPEGFDARDLECASNEWVYRKSTRTDKTEFIAFYQYRNPWTDVNSSFNMDGFTGPPMPTVREAIMALMESMRRVYVEVSNPA